MEPQVLPWFPVLHICWVCGEPIGSELRKAEYCGGCDTWTHIPCNWFGKDLNDYRCVACEEGEL